MVSVVDGEELTFSEHFASGLPHQFGRDRAADLLLQQSARRLSGLRRLGNRLEVDPDLVIPNKALSIAEGAIASWVRRGSTATPGTARSSRRLVGTTFSTRVPVSELSDKHLQIVLFGSKVSGSRFATSASGVGESTSFGSSTKGWSRTSSCRYKETESDYIRSDIERYMATRPCPICKGARLKPEALSVTMIGRSTRDHFSVVNALAFFTALEERRPFDDPPAARCRPRWPDERDPVLTDREFAIARQILKEIRARLGFLVDVGLDYLTLGRTAGTLSGGEAQRIGSPRRSGRD